MPNRRGAAYLITLGITLLVSVLGLAGLKIVRLTRAQQSQVTDMGDARMIARAALDMSLLRMETDSNWRSKMEAGIWGTDQLLGRGSYSLEAVDPNDADLTDSELDPVLIVGTGKAGSAVQKLQMQVNFDAVGLSCLKSSVHSNGNISLPSFTGATLTVDQLISSNAAVAANSTIVNGDVEAVGTVTGTNIQGTVTTGVEAREMPNTSSVFDFYVANGTLISASSLPQEGGYWNIQNTVLTPNYNPITGETNALGIYIIDCESKWVRVINARINGTLVFINISGSKPMTVAGSVNWQPAVANYPALLVQGGAHLAFDSNTALNEAAIGANLNPAGAPYAGETDVSIDDVYPSILKGLVYISDDVRVPTTGPKVQGVIVVENEFIMLPNSELDVIYDSNFFYNPPPGFQGTPKTTVVSGSFRRVVGP